MTASEVLVNVLFYVFAIASVAGALGVAASRNIVRSAFALLAVLFSAAALYALMKADFIAGAQVLIYVGGILVLIIFAVMLTHRITDVKISNDSTPGPAAFCAVLCLLFALVVIILPVPDPGHNKWDAGRGSEAVRTGEFSLVQFQADGKTGIARGGSTFGDEAVVGVTVREQDRPKGATRVKVKLSSEKAPDLQFSEPLVAGDTTLVRLTKLPEKKFAWKLCFDGPQVESKWMDGGEFQVYKGVTEPVAMGLAGPYLFAFEAVSVLLLAALVGAAFLARKEVKD